MNNKLKVAIMQPYIFPYIGYFNLINASDKFVFYDDVNFIKKGWINRNYVMFTGGAFRFTVPLKKSSQNLMINNIKVHDLNKFSNKFLSQLSTEYRSSHYKAQVLDYVRDVLTGDYENIGELASESVKKFYRYVGINKEFRYSSTDFLSTAGLEKSERLIEITKSLGSTEYLNAMGGISLYSKDCFSMHGINLSFVKPILQIYQHCNRKNAGFTPGLSIIDIMMNNPESDIKKQLDSFEII